MADQNTVPINDVLRFGGIPIRVDPWIPEGEVWMVIEGKRGPTIRIHEGQQAGETVEEWLTKPKIYRVVNIGDGLEWPKTKIEWPKKELEVGDWP